MIQSTDRKRLEVQAGALQALISSNGIGTLHIQTGVGKCKITNDFIFHFADIITSVLILVPLSRLIDTWHKELDKWNDNYMFIDENTCKLGDDINVTIETIQTAYKWNNKKFTLIVFDEVHKMLTPEYHRIISNTTSVFKIGLTARTNFSNGGRFKKRTTVNNIES